MKSVITFCLLLFALSSNAQIGANNEIIVDGNSKIKVKPDISILTLTINKDDSVEKRAIRSANIEMEKLTKMLSGMGFKAGNIRISDYKVSSSNIREESKRYTVSNTLTVRFHLDEKLIDECYRRVQSQNLSDLDISFDAVISDSLNKATKLRLLKAAVEDAKRNAANIAAALNVDLGKVKRVSNSSGADAQTALLGMVKFVPPVVKKDEEVKENESAFGKYEVEEKELEEKIIAIYEIENRK
jgi:uncharacterized protein